MEGKDTGKTNAPRLSLKLKSRHHSLERQSSARDLAVSEHRQDTDSANAISSQSDEIDDHFKEVLRRLVHRLIDSENAFYALGDRIKKLEQSALDNTCPKGLAIKPVKATGKNAGPLQQDFDAILKDAQKRIVQAVIKDLKTQETETSHLCQENRDKIEQSLTEWRQKFRCADETFLLEADKQLMKARKFVDNFYFQCASLRASKELQESLKKEAKAKRAETQMEQDFTPTEQTITNIVRRELSAVESKRKKKSRKPETNQKALASPKPGLGLKFRPTLKPPSETEFLPQIQDFCRSVRLHCKFANTPGDPNFNPRLYVKSDWNTPREDPDLEDKLFHIQQELCRNASSSKPRWKANLRNNTRQELKNLKENKSVRVTDTDKNLGPAVVTTDWLKTESLKCHCQSKPGNAKRWGSADFPHIFSI
ncbi:hypothetical protein ACROYT_G021696 [Oculina patagonica]